MISWNSDKLADLPKVQNDHIATLTFGLSHVVSTNCIKISYRKDTM